MADVKNANTASQKARKYITLEHSCQIRAVYQLSNIRGKQLLKMFPQYSKAQIYIHAKKPLNGEKHFDKRKLNKGRPKKLSAQDSRNIIRTLGKVRKTDGTFTSRRLQLQAGCTHVSNKTVTRCLNKAGYHYLQSRKKGLLTAQDLKKRLAYCRDIRKRKLTQDYWNNDIAFYLDGVGFEFKTQPLDQARAPKAREWRKKSEGLDINCVAKGKKEGSTNAKFMVAIPHGKGVLFCKQYFGPITGYKFSKIIRAEFKNAFIASGKPGKRFLMDGCPRQNSARARGTWERMGAKVISIPSRSPDINPIENFFNLVSAKLKRDVVDRNIEKETFEEFSDRVKDCVLGFKAEEIDPIIESMDKRISLIIQRKGQRIKY